MADNDAQPMTLTTKQRAAITALVSCGRVPPAAVMAGVSERTLYRWIENPVFRAALTAAESDAVGEASRQLVSLSTLALGTIREFLEDPNASPTLRLRAAQMVLENLLKVRELANVEERITAMEAVNNG